jgi:LPXTG-motif cell wall-anchored protein
LASTGAEGLAGSVALAVLLLGAGATLALRRRVRAR